MAGLTAYYPESSFHLLLYIAASRSALALGRPFPPSSVSTAVMASDWNLHRFKRTFILGNRQHLAEARSESKSV
jgi:hypothetical protein